MSFEIGNLENMNSEHPERGGWFIGNFMPEGSLLHTENCEAKFVRHPKGLKKASHMHFDRPVRTAVTLISGKLQLDFASGKNVLLTKPGDYIVFDREAHSTEVPEECLVFVVRWYP